MRFLTAFDSGVVALKLDILNVQDRARGVEVAVGGDNSRSTPALYSSPGGPGTRTPL